MKAAPTHKTYSSFNVTPIWTQFQSRQNRKATNWSSNSRPTEVEPRCPPNLVGNVACSRRIPVAVGTTIADRPPHRTVRARLRIRLPPWMSGVEALCGIRVQDAGYRNTVVQNRVKPIPGCPALLTATEQNKPPQPS